MRKKWLCGLLLLLCLCILTGCGQDNWMHGEVVERVRDADGRLTAFVIENTDGKQVGFRLAEETLIWPHADDFTEEDFLYEEPAGVVVSVWPEGRAEKLVTASGQKVRTYDAKSVHIEELLTPDALTLSDGTSVGIWAGRWGENRYVLEDSTELLRERSPRGPENVVNGLANVGDLSETARTAVLTYYEEQGMLYDIPTELERAYAAWLAHDGETAFSAYMVQQETSPSASNDRLMYFQTAVTLPLHDSEVTEWKYGAAFDRETGERIEPWGLFTCGPEDAKEAILTAAGVKEYYPELAEEMKAHFSWEQLVFFDSGVSLSYPANVLVGAAPDGGYMLIAEYDKLADVLQPWAIPIASES